MSKPPKRPPFERLLDRIEGARLCYGDPVVAGDRTVIPVSRVRASGGFGWGGGMGGKKDDGQGAGGGGGGHVDALPMGFIEVTPDGTRFHEIPDPERVQRMLKASAAALTTVMAGVAGARRLTGRRRRALSA